MSVQSTGLRRTLLLQRALVAAVAAVIAFTVDRVTKELAASQIPLGAHVEVIGDWVRLSHLHNSGTAFGLLPGSAPVLAYVTLPVLALIGWAYLRSVGSSLLAIVLLGLVLGAGAGNTLDRALQGYVEDFIDIGLPGGVRFWMFNLSDSALVSGILLAFLSQMLIERRTARAATRRLAD